MKHKIYTILLLSAVLSLQACNSENKSGNATDSALATDKVRNKISDMDTLKNPSIPIDPDQFIKETSISGLREIETAKIAQKNGVDPMIGIFASQMIKDHVKINKELADLAKEKGITFPKELPATEQARLDELRDLTGKPFDKRYMDMMVEDYKRNVALFRAATVSKDKKISAFAESTLKTIELNSSMAVDVRFNLKN